MEDEQGDFIPIDLAIRRELAYRVKVKMLGLKPFGASEWKEFVPLEVSTGTRNEDPMPEPIEIPSSDSSLETCEASCMRISLSGKKRKELHSSPHCPSTQDISDDVQILVRRHDDLYCDLCQVSFSSPYNLKQHLNGRSHRAKLQKKDGGEEPNQRKWCELCQIWCMDEFALQQHLEGQKHRANEHGLMSDKAKVEIKANQRQRCHLCDLWCMDDFTFKQHLSGKKHLMNLHRSGIPKKFVQDQLPSE